jgi:tetratricopeptide (TPR) repeat protein
MHYSSAEWKQLLERSRRRAEEIAALTSEEIRERMRRSPDERLLWLALAGALWREGKIEEALAELGQRCEGSTAERRLATAHRAHLLSRLQRNEEAIADFERVVASGDTQPANFFELGKLYYRVGDVRSARAYWRRAIESNRDYYKHDKYMRAWGARLVFATVLNVAHYARCCLLWSYLRPSVRAASARH